MPALATLFVRVRPAPGTRQAFQSETDAAVGPAASKSGDKAATTFGTQLQAGFARLAPKLAKSGLLTTALTQAGSDGGGSAGTAAGTAFQSKLKAPISKAVDEMAHALETSGALGGQKGGLAAGRSFLSQLAKEHPEITPTINSAKALVEAKALRAALTRELSGAGAAGAGGGAAGGAGGAASIFSGGAASALSNPYVAGGAAVLGTALAAFVAQAVGGAIVTGLGAALAGVAVYGALQAKPVQKVFGDLKTSVGKDLAAIGKPFQSVLESVFKTAGKVFKDLTPVFTLSSKIISGPLKTFVGAFLTAFTQPAVAKSVTAVASAFAGILKAVTPSLPGDVAAIAGGITNIAAAISKNPQILADFVQWLTDVVKWSLDAIAALTRVGTWIETQVKAFKLWWGVMVGDVKTAWHDVQHWVDASIAGVQKAFDVVKRLLVTDEKGWIDKGVAWFAALPGRIVTGVGKAATVLYNWGKGVITGLWSGLKDIWGTVTHWISGLPGAILHFLGIKSPPQWAIDAGKHIMNGLGIGLSQGKTKLGNITRGLAATVGGALGSGVQQWSGLVSQVLSMLGLAPGLKSRVLYQMQTESGGNPLAINQTDINAQMGDPSRGLMQVIGTTFATYAGGLAKRGIYDPLANIFAALNYAKHVYGPTLMRNGMGIGSGHGYAAGGLITEPIFGIGRSGRSYTFGEAGTERVTPGAGLAGGDVAGQLSQIAGMLGVLIGAVQQNADDTAAGLASVLGGAARSASMRAAYSPR